ncbi:hypothetical protein GGI20_005891 [Coemansia sp. BCRC 34301]|nr:hypothetical protein GGI20_005891 [Coemansia sp. BCRC 34301]
MPVSGGGAGGLPGTPTTTRSGEQHHGLSALEEGVIQQHSGYSVFDDDRVLRICDEADTTATGTLDGVEIAGGSGGAGGGGEEANDLGGGSGHTAMGRRWRLAQLVARHRVGNNESVSSTYSSPVAGGIGGESGSFDNRQNQHDKRRRWWRHRHMRSASTSASAILAPMVAAQGEKPQAPQGWWSSMLRRFVLAGGVNRFGERDAGRRAEHIGFVAAFALSSVGFILWGTLVPRALCSTAQTFTLGQVEERRFVAANGIVADFALAQSSFGRAMRGYSGYDATPVFPLLGLLSSDYSTPQVELCMGNASAVDSFLAAWRQAPGSLYGGGPEERFPTRCPLPQAPQTSGARCLVDRWPQFVAAKVGMLQLSKDQVRARGASWVMSGTRVYDASLLAYAPADAPLAVAVGNARKGSAVSAAGQQCLDMLLLRGTTEATQSAFACANTNVVAWVTFGAMFLALLARLVTAEAHAAVRARKAKALLDEESQAPQPTCVVVVPIADEPADAVARTLQSVARSAYPDTRTVLWVICDGPASLGSVLRVLAHGDGMRSDAKFYGAYGGPGGACGAARVLSGHYECGRHRIAYVVTAKETRRGGVDSLMMAVGQFRTTNGPSGPGSPVSEGSTVFLDEEIEAQLSTLGHSPHAVSYCALVACGVQMDPQALPQFVSRMQADQRVAVASGSLYAVGRPTSVRAVVQRADFYLQHFVAPICASLAGVACPLDQLFAIYRVRCLRRAHSHVDALVRRHAHSKGLAWPANDCLLAPRVVAASAPNAHWVFEPNARAEIELPTASDAALRQWFRTRVLALVDAVRSAPSASPITALRLFVLLVTPAAVCMLYVEVVLAISHSAPSVVVCELIGAYVFVSLVALFAARRPALALHWLVYCAVAVPYYSVWIPTTALLTMNRVWRAPDHEPCGDQDPSPLDDRDPDPLVQDAHLAMRRVLRDLGHRQQRLILPDSPEFYAVCERATAALIAAHPNANAQDLAHAVNRAADAAIPPPSLQPCAYPAVAEDESD